MRQTVMLRQQYSQAVDDEIETHEKVHQAKVTRLRTASTAL
jgi:hypothetical protein